MGTKGVEDQSVNDARAKLLRAAEGALGELARARERLSLELLSSGGERSVRELPATPAAAADALAAAARGFPHGGDVSVTLARLSLCVRSGLCEPGWVAELRGLRDQTESPERSSIVRLLPCPFCGSDTVRILPQGEWKSVDCWTCSAEVRVVTDDDAAAAAEWNRRGGVAFFEGQRAGRAVWPPRGGHRRQASDADDDSAPTRRPGRASDAVARHLRERAHVVLDAALDAYVAYEVNSAAADADDDASYLSFAALDEVESAVRCVLGRYVAHGDDPGDALGRYVYDQDLDEAAFRERVREEAGLVKKVAGPPDRLDEGE